MIDRVDPYRSFMFEVEIDGIIVGGFTEVSGLTVETSVKRFREGGVNNIEYKIPEYTKTNNLVLKKGLTDIDILWRWYEQVTYGNVMRKSGTVILKNEEGEPRLLWHFSNGFPVKWEGPQLTSTSNVVAIEKVEIVFESLFKC